jgi:hypothetical protein
MVQALERQSESTARWARGCARGVLRLPGVTMTSTLTIDIRLVMRKTFNRGSERRKQQDRQTKARREAPEVNFGTAKALTRAPTP